MSALHRGLSGTRSAFRNAAWPDTPYTTFTRRSFLRESTTSRRSGACPGMSIDAVTGRSVVGLLPVALAPILAVGQLSYMSRKRSFVQIGPTHPMREKLLVGKRPLADTAPPRQKVV